MKQFNLEEYLKNPKRKVVTRDGKKVRIICTDFDNPDFPVICGIEGSMWPSSFTKSGLLIKGAEHPAALFFAPEKHEGWGVICGSFLARAIFTAKEEAEEFVKRMQSKDFVAIAKIEWEE